MKIGVIGTGMIGRLRAETAHENPGCRLIAVCDVDQASAEDTGQSLGAAAYTDYRRMLERGGLDAVVVSGPAPLHEQMCVDCFEAGLHVLVEKPLAKDVETCERILAAQKKAGKALGIGFNHRFYPAMKYVKDTLRQGTLGDLDHFRVYGGHDGLNNFRADWMFKGELSGGGAMMDVGIHMTDLARYLAGEITEVYAVVSDRMWQVDKSEDNAICVFKTKAGLPIIYQATWNAWKGYEVSVEAYGKLGMVRGSYAPMFNLLVTQAGPGEPRKKTYKAYPEIILREKLQGWQTSSKGTFQGELQDFLRMCRGEPAHDLANAWDGLRSVQITEAVYESSRTGQPVTLPEVPA